MENPDSCHVIWKTTETESDLLSCIYLEKAYAVRKKTAQIVPFNSSEGDQKGALKIPMCIEKINMI